MKRFTAILLAIVFCFTLLLGGCSGDQQPSNQTTQPETAAASTEATQPETTAAATEPSTAAPTGEVIELSLVSEYPGTHPGVTGAIIPWIKEVEEKSGNKVKITFNEPNALVPKTDAYDSVVSGMVDILAGWPSNNPGKFPLVSVVELPFIVPNGAASVYVLQELEKKYPEFQKQFEETKLLWQWSGASTQLHSNKPVQTVGDLKGMKLIGTAPATLEDIKMLGANPVELPGADIYMAMERNMADGVILPFAAVKSFKVDEVSKYHTLLNMSVGPFYMVINKDKFSSLPADVQKIIEESSVEMGFKTNKAIAGPETKLIEGLKGSGHTFYDISDADRQKMLEMLKPKYDNWVKDMEKKGYVNAQQILNDAMSLSAEYSKK